MRNSWKVMVLALVLVLSGCLGKKDRALTLKCIGWGGVEEAQILQAVVDEFKKAHPGVEVELQRVPYSEYITKILTQFSSGLAPDVLTINAEQLFAFSSRDILVDLNPYAQKDPDLKLGDFYPQALNHYTRDGKLLGLPRDIAPVAVVYYNKKRFDEAGLPYPKDDWDTDQFLAVAKALTKKNAAGKTVQYGFADDWSIWDSWVFAFGGNTVDDNRKPTRCALDSPAAVAAIQFRADLIHKWGVMPSPAQVTAMSQTGNSDLFMNGTSAMFLSGIWQVPAFRRIKSFDWDVVELPRAPGRRHGFFMSAAGYGILKTSKNPELAYELVKFLAGEVGQKHMVATGLTQPALRTLAVSPVFLDGQIPKSKKFLVDAVKDGTMRPADPRIDEWLTIINAGLDRVWAGDETAQQALSQVVPEVNRKFYSKP